MEVCDGLLLGLRLGGPVRQGGVHLAYPRDAAQTVDQSEQVFFSTAFPQDQSSASSSSAVEPGRTTMRSRATSEASTSPLISAKDVSRSRTSLTRLASLRLGNKRRLMGLARTRRTRAR